MDHGIWIMDLVDHVRWFNRAKKRTLVELIYCLVISQEGTTSAPIHSLELIFEEMNEHWGLKMITQGLGDRQILWSWQTEVVGYVNNLYETLQVLERVAVSDGTNQEWHGTELDWSEIILVATLV